MSPPLGDSFMELNKVLLKKEESHMGLLFFHFE